MSALFHRANPHRGTGLPDRTGLQEGAVVTDAAAAMALFAACPAEQATPLIDATALATQLGIAALHVKDERERMGLGSFKALGAAHAIAKMAARRTGGNMAAMATVLTGETFVCASAGNHGLSVAAGAPIFGARAVVYLSDTVPESFAGRLRGKGADVVRAGAIYEESMDAAMQAAADNGWTLLSDSSWEGYAQPAIDVMEGYLIMGDEVARALAEPPTHVFLQAGVGGLAAGVAASIRTHFGDAPRIVIVEPEAARALIGSIEAGRVTETPGPVSTMGRLDCKAPSHVALSYLAREADDFVTMTDAAVDESLRVLAQAGLATTPSGGAGFAALHHGALEMREALGLGPASRALIILSEAA